MRNPIVALLLSLAIVAVPGIALAQDQPATDPPGAPDTMGIVASSLVEQLCSSATSDETGSAACLLGVAAILAGESAASTASPGSSAQPQGLLDRARQAVDQTLAAAPEVDLRSAMDQAVAAVRDSDPRAALDAAITAAQGVDLQAALDAAVAAASEVDLQAALGEVVDQAQAIDLQAAVEHTLGSADVDVRALLADGVDTTRTVTAAAQAWLEENADVVCTGGSLGVGAAAAAVVVHLTGSPGLAIAAFQETERLSNDACGEIAQ